MLVCASSLTAMAQSNQKQRISREQLAQKQAQYIASQLALDDATTAKYVATYVDYQKEVWALGPRMGKKGNATEADTEARMKARFERSQKILQLREKYYQRYSKFLTAKQIERSYQIEKQMMKRLGRRHAGPRQHARGK